MEPWLIILISVLSGVLLLIIAAFFIIGYVTFNVLLSRKVNRDFIVEEAKKNYRDPTAKEKETYKKSLSKWRKGTTCDEVFVISEDFLKLRGDMYLQKEESHRWVIAMHGYAGWASTMLPVVVPITGDKYNALVLDARAHGRSEGDYIGMGWLERRDLVKWIEFIVNRDPKASIALYGISMGGATVLATSGEELPNNVKCFIEDCGFTTVYRQFHEQIRRKYHIPTFPILDIASMFSGFKAGYNFKSADLIKQVAKCKKPLLIIHGEKDVFVSVRMAQTIYDAATCKKELLLIPDAGHTDSYLVNPELYFGSIDKFLTKYLK